MIKRIGVLTSGGDAPGMNAVIRAVVRSALAQNIEVYGIYDGYKGILTKKIKLLTNRSVDNIINNGGTFLGTARLPEFKDEEVRINAVEILKEYGIEALVTIGGDGTYQGALGLTKLGINCIGVPGTIDNDIASTDYTIGFDTAVSVAVDAIDRLRDTCSSHNRCSIVEVMGRYCGDIAYQAGVAGGANYIITGETGLNEEELFKTVREVAASGKRHCIIVITEHVCDVNALAKKVEAETGFETRATILGHIQRGGRPTHNDRVLASRLGNEAVEELIKGNGGVCMGIISGKLVATPIEEALKMKKNLLASFDVLAKKLG